jgi:Protein of unknown function (DUF3987)/VirE N-terminal domain
MKVTLADNVNGQVIVSMVVDASATGTRDADPIRIIAHVRGGRWREPIEHIRRSFSNLTTSSGIDKKEAKKAIAADKKKLPGILWSGQFSSREEPVAEKLLKHSGLLCADLDDLGKRLPEIRAKLLASAHLFALFTSPTGTGLKVVFRVAADAANHPASFRAVECHVFELTGEKIDGSCKDVGRLCFVSFDPNAFVNTKAAELPPLPQEKQASRKEKPFVGLPNPETRRRIAAELLGKLRWDADMHGFCQCPGQGLHTTGESERDCEIHLDGAATIHCFHNHCEGIVAGVNYELRSRIAKAERVLQRLPARTGAKVWEEPKPLPADLPDVPPFDFAFLPNTFRDWIEDISERMQCPPDFPAVGAMVALGSLVGRKIGIRPKRHDDWLVIPNLWGCVVGRPGLMKTPALEQPLLPLRRLVAEAFEKYAAEMREHEIGAMLFSQAKKVSERKIAACLKAGDEKAARIEAACHLEKESGGPVLRRYETNDPTIEKLGVILAENPNGVLLFRDELVGFLRGLDKEGHESDRATYLEMWNGTGTFTSDRIQRGTIRTPAIVSILGGIVPYLLTAYVREAVQGGTGADGLLQRIQLFVWPDVSKEWRNVDRWPDTEAKNEAFAVFKYLEELTPQAVGADASDGIPFLRFTNDAQGKFDSWRAQLERKLRSDTEHPAFEAHLSKYRKLVPALALLIHLANRDTGPVSLNALEKALLWVTYLEAHARRIYSAVLRPDTAAARELAKHLERRELQGRFTLREIYRKGWAGLGGKDEVEAATEILCDLGWILPVGEPGRTNGRPASPTFEINPKIYQIAHRELTELPKPTSGSFDSEVVGEVEDSRHLVGGSESGIPTLLVEEFV